MPCDVELGVEEEPDELDPEVDEPWFWVTPKGASIKARAPKLRKRNAERMIYTFLGSPRRGRTRHLRSPWPCLINPNQAMLLPGYLVLFSSPSGAKST